jgi:hypothetical protein
MNLKTLVTCMSVAATITAYGSLSWAAFDCYTGHLDAGDLQYCVDDNEDMAYGSTTGVSNQLWANTLTATDISMFGWDENDDWIPGCELYIHTSFTGPRYSPICSDDIIYWDMYGAK